LGLEVISYVFLRQRDTIGTYLEVKMQEIPKDVLLKAARADVGAFEQIYKAACGFVYNVALRITNNEADAEEVTQDVFMKIYKNLKNFQFRSSFKTWVYRITVNSAINACKRTPKEMKQKADYELALKTQASTQERTEIDQDQRQALLSRILDILNPDQRACIILRELQGLSYQEIARALRINLNTVRSRLKRARETLMAYRGAEVIKNEL